MNNDLYRNKYRIQTNRLQAWDYSSSGWYFITVCTKNRRHLFGEIIDKHMYLSELGHFTVCSWLAMERIFSVMVNNAWVVMPNHTHFLFGIRNPKSILEPNEFGKTVKNSVSSIINHFKGRVTKYAQKEKIEFQWQTRFYDHIVRNEEEFNTIKNYIINNPKNWKIDKFYDNE